MDYIKIEDFCEILDSQRVPITGKDRVAGEYPYYGANGIQGYVDDYIFDDDLVLVAEDGGYFGSKTKPIAYKVSGKCWVNNHAHVLKAKENVDTDYLCYSLMFYNVDKIVNGATRQKLNQKQLRQMLVPKRSKSKQLEIVRQLKTIQRIIENKGALISEYDQLIKSRFVEMFGDPITNNKGWDVKDLNEITDVRDGTHDSPKYVDIGYPFVTSKNLVNGNIDFSTCQLISKDDLEKINQRSFVDDGDILMPMIGTIGGAIIVKKDRDFAIKNVALIKFNKENSIVDRKFILNVLNSDSMNEFFNSIKKGGTQNFISLGLIRQMPTIIPPLKLQNEFALFVEQVDKLKFVVQKSLDETQKLFDSLMQEYFG